MGKTIYIFVFCALSLHPITVHGNIVFPCITPDAEHAYCVSIFSCRHSMKLLGTLEPSAIEYVKRSICLGCEERGFMMVCCKMSSSNASTNTTTTTTSTTTTTTSTQLPLVTKKKVSRPTKTKSSVDLLPSLKYCGFQHTDDRPYNATETAIDEFPWLVHIRFSNMEYDAQFADRCNGVLINNLYVLTDYYCAAEAIKVKIGEYNTNETVSCNLNSEIRDCTENTIEVAVEERIRLGKSENGPYDFGLLRLSKKLTYSDFVRPICLPLNQSRRPEKLDSLIFSGWGSHDAAGIAKKRLIYNVAPDEECYKYDKWLEGNILIGNASFICSVPKNNSSAKACNGEHGGPFMYEVSRRHQWFLEGIIVQVMYDVVEKGVICTNTYPVNGIRMTPRIINWILASIRP